MVATAKRNLWHQLCIELMWVDLWSLCWRLSQQQARGDVDSLLINGEVASTNKGKLVALAPIFFSPFPPLRDSHQAIIDFAWGTHQALSNQDFMEVLLLEV